MAGKITGKWRDSLAKVPDKGVWVNLGCQIETGRSRLDRGERRGKLSVGIVTATVIGHDRR